MSSMPDDKNWEDVEPPPSDGEEDESIEVVKDDVKEGPPREKNGRRLDVTALEFKPDEAPLLGYAIASFVFFLAAVTRKQKKASSLGMDSSPELNYNDILGDIYSGDDLVGEDDAMVMDALSQSIIEGCEASYNAICGSMGWFGEVMGGYGSGLPSGHFAYALCLGIFGVLMAGGVIAWKRTSKSVDRVGDYSDDGDEEDDTNANQAQLGGFLGKYLWVVNSILLLWAGIGWAFFTFGGNQVFAYTGNGFFALWAMLLCAIWNLGFTTKDLVKESENINSCVYALVATSVVTIIELTTGPGGWRYRSNRGISAYALAVSVIAIIFGLVIVGVSFMEERGRSTKIDAKISLWCLLVVSVLLAVAAFLTTFIGPFLTTGNGYFAVWGSVLFSGIACSKLRKEMQ